MFVDEKVKNANRLFPLQGRGDYIRLDQNENPDGLPVWLFDEVKSKITPQLLATYPEEKKLTEDYARLLGLTCENVSLTDGSVVGMGYAIKVFGEPGKNLICATPAFAMYKVYAEMNGMNPVMLRYRPDFTFDAETILDSIDDNTGIVVLVNPNMPIGNVYERADIERIVRKAARYGAPVIIDEAYYYFYDRTAVDLLSKYDNILILRTFSKLLSIPGLRLAAVISTPEIIRYINNYKPHYTVNAVALLFGEAIVAHHDRLVAELKADFETGKAYIYQRLEENGYTVLPTHGCFLCVKPKTQDPAALVDRMRQRGILISRGNGDLSDYLRVTIAKERYMKAFADTLLGEDR